jgi:hypothetical protein
MFSSLGIGMGLWIISYKLHGSIPSAATAVVCALFLSLGIQSTFFAMLFEMLENQRR